MHHNGEIIHQPSGRSESFQICQLSLEHRDDLIAMQAIVQQHVEEKTTLKALTNEEFEKILKGDGLFIGVYVDQSLIAFRALWYPGDDQGNLGRDLGLPKDEWSKVVHQEISSVHPEYRGNGLQKRMGRWIMDIFDKNNQDKCHLFCTVHPANTASLKDKFSQGMAIVKIKNKYAGILRYILYRSVQKPWAKDPLTEVLVELDALEEQKHLLDEGYYGFNWSDGNIVFAKKKGCSIG